MSNENENYEVDLELETKEESQKTSEKVEEKAGEKLFNEDELRERAALLAERQLMQLAIDDPDFADYLKRKMNGGQKKAQPEPKRAEEEEKIPKKKMKEERAPEEVERLRKELEEMRLSQEGKYQEMEWKRSVEKLDDIFSSDSFFCQMPEDLQLKMKNTMVRSFYQAKQAGDRQSEKAFFNLFKKDIEGLASYSVTKWRQERKQANSLPVSPKEIQSSIQKHKGDYAPTAKDLQSGKIKDMIKEVVNFSKFKPK